MKNLDAVYKKWQNRADPAGGGIYTAGDANDLGRKLWQDKFGDNIQAPQRAPSRFRPRKRKNKVCFVFLNCSSYVLGATVYFFCYTLLYLLALAFSNTYAFRDLTVDKWI